MKKILLLILPFLVVACAKRPFLSNARTSDEAYNECHRLTERGDYEKANDCIEVLRSRFGGSAAAAEAELEMGDNYFRKKEYLLAVETYLSFLKLHPSHEKTGYAYYRLGLSYLRESPKAIDRDQKYLETAIRYLEISMNQSSGEIQALAREKWVEARKRIARRHFYVGRFYHRTGEYLSAIPRFQEIVTTFSGLGLDEKALFLLGDSYRRLKERERAEEVLSVFDQHFPASRYRKKLASDLKGSR